MPVDFARTSKCRYVYPADNCDPVKHGNLSRHTTSHTSAIKARRCGLKVPRKKTLNFNGGYVDRTPQLESWTQVGLFWATGQIPKECCESAVTPIYMSIVSVLLLQIILHPLSSARERRTGKNQAGFWSRRDCIDHISIPQVLGRKHRFMLSVFRCRNVAFDSVDYAFCDAASHWGVYQKLISLFRFLNTNGWSRIRSYGDVSPSLPEVELPSLISSFQLCIWIDCANRRIPMWE